MTVKDKIFKAIQEMPQDVTFDELMERLNLLYKVEQGHQAVTTGETILSEEVKQKLTRGCY